MVKNQQKLFWKWFWASFVIVFKQVIHFCTKWTWKIDQKLFCLFPAIFGHNIWVEDKSLKNGICSEILPKIVKFCHFFFFKKFVQSMRRKIFSGVWNYNWAITNGAQWGTHVSPLYKFQPRFICFCARRVESLFHFQI